MEGVGDVFGGEEENGVTPPFERWTILSQSRSRNQTAQLEDEDENDFVLKAAAESYRTSGRRWPAAHR